LATSGDHNLAVDSIHFIDMRSDHKSAMPLISTRGWPGSVIEMLEVVGLLIDPTSHGGRAEEAFNLVRVAALPILVACVPLFGKELALFGKELEIVGK